MRKFCVALLCAVVFMFSACNTQVQVKNAGIPTDFAWIEFWNGGACMGRYDDVHMEIEIVSTSNIAGHDIYFYKYHLINEKNDIDEFIIDSEALALKYTLQYREKNSDKVYSEER